MNHSYRVSAFFLLCFLCLTGCVKSMPQIQLNYSAEWKNTVKEWPDKQLEKKFAEYWDLRFHGPLKTAFQMEAPHFQELISGNHYTTLLKEFLNQKMENIVVRDITKETDYAVVVDCMQKIKLSNGEIKEVYIKDNWVIVGDTWYHFYRDPILFPQAM